MLFIDTTSGTTSVAVMTENREIFSYYDGEKNMQVERIAKITITALEKASLSLSKVKYIGCNVGPGSFNSVRIGVSYANGILCTESRILPIQLNSYQLCLYFIYKRVVKDIKQPPFFIGIQTEKNKVIMLLEPIMPSQLIANLHYYLNAFGAITEISMDDFIAEDVISSSSVAVLSNDELDTCLWRPYYLFGDKCANITPSSATGVALMELMVSQYGKERNGRFFTPFYGSLPSSMKIKDS
ncbi:Glycoprotease family protein [Candidatus Fokinia solitaria]|uniref:Glycoprotease family protein n=1 Tax=Candidatus Fokinia solitaria TaxID=1802984 RepID=A0A2U8BRW3_9RICK|nr:hypothetical protein [Candidatus Fokinia solitaria]AWD33078.1 Glycoprotease family protein [Candidatus Fokinia solitaria]